MKNNDKTLNKWHKFKNHIKDLMDKDNTYFIMDHPKSGNGKEQYHIFHICRSMYFVFVGHHVDSQTSM